MSMVHSPSAALRRMEVDVGEMRRYIREVFEKEFGTGIVQEVYVSWNNPDMIDVAVHVTAKKEGLWDTCLRVAQELQRWGIRAALRPEYPV